MKKKIKSNLFNEFEEKVLSGGNYAYVYDKEDSSLTDAAFNVFSNFDINDIKDWKTTDTASTTNVSILFVAYIFSISKYSTFVTPV